MAAKQEERRDFFRINQDVLFDYNIVDSYTADSAEPDSQFEDSLAMGVVKQLRKLDLDAGKILRSISEQNSALAEYLNIINKKVDLAVRQSLVVQEKQPTNNQATRVNLSEDGIAFVADRALYKGNFLVLRLIFLPQYLPVVLFAKVIRCVSQDQGHQVAARFHRIQDKQRQELSRQILRAQAASRQTS